MSDLLFIKMCDGRYAQSQIEDWLFEEVANEQDGQYDDMTFDDYDSSIELLRCDPDLRLSAEQQQWLWDQGVLHFWLNHRDGMQTRYDKPGTKYYGEPSIEGHRYPQRDTHKTGASPLPKEPVP